MAVGGGRRSSSEEEARQDGTGGGTLVHSSTPWYTMAHPVALWYTLTPFGTLWYTLAYSKELCTVVAHSCVHRAAIPQADHSLWGSSELKLSSTYIITQLSCALANGSGMSMWRKILFSNIVRFDIKTFPGGDLLPPTKFMGDVQILQYAQTCKYCCICRLADIAIFIDL